MYVCLNCDIRVPEGQLSCPKCQAVILNQFAYFHSSFDTDQDSLDRLYKHFRFLPSKVQYKKKVAFSNKYCALTETSFNFVRDRSVTNEVYSGIICKLFERKREKWNVVWYRICSTVSKNKPEGKQKISRREQLQKKQEEENKGNKPAITTKGRKPASAGLPGQGKRR
jgi:hypothetical protein